VDKFVGCANHVAGNCTKQYKMRGEGRVHAVILPRMSFELLFAVSL
jgi:hypothetical protein